MNNNDYFWPGIAAIAVAFLFPVYWIYEIATMGTTFSFSDYPYNSGPASWIFLLIGALNVYVYYAFKHQFYNHHNYRDVDVVLGILIAVCSAFYLGMFAVDALSPWFGTSYNSIALMSIWVGSLIVFGVLDILLAVLLLRKSKELPVLVRVFAVVNLLLGIFEITVLLSVAVIVLFPIAIFTLALNFWRKPEVIEIV
ncbi:MAG: hypothetical protein GXP15_17865 [Gammaproteobacteria bacterium]|nr:hypothetical protein [Gammaproteobacteria bacterium]